MFKENSFKTSLKNVNALFREAHKILISLFKTLQHKEVENEKFKEKVLELQSLSASEKSCFQLALQGINKSGRFLLDPDGHHLNHPPMEVECKFPSNLTLIHSIFSGIRGSEDLSLADR